MLRTLYNSFAKSALIACLGFLILTNSTAQQLFPPLGQFMSVIAGAGANSLSPFICVGTSVGCYTLYRTSNNTDRAWWGGTTTGPTVLKGNGNTAAYHQDSTDIFKVVGSIGLDTKCASVASPAVCGVLSSGSVAIPAAATTLQVNTTRVTSNSNIILVADSSLGTLLGVTCNTSIPTLSVSARTAATNFTITTTAAPVTNPLCLHYFIVN